MLKERGIKIKDKEKNNNERQEEKNEVILEDMYSRAAETK